MTEAGINKYLWDQLPPHLLTAITNWLKRSSELEGYAAGVAAQLARSPLIRLEERDFVGDVIYPEELAHRDLLRSMARSLMVPMPDPMVLPRLATMTDLGKLMLLTRGEGALLLEVGKFKAMLPDDEWFHASMDKIVRDEQGHRRWSRQVVHRLHEEGAAVPAHVLRAFDPFHEVRAIVDEVRRG